MGKPSTKATLRSTPARRSIDVYAEVEPTGEGELVQVFVRDRGKGFDPADVADTRMGVRSSIVGRMERHGGSAKIRSAPGRGNRRSDWR